MRLQIGIGMVYPEMSAAAAREYLATKEVSTEYGIPEATLRYWRHVGEGPASFKLGGKRVVYRRREIERWIAEQEAASTRGGVA